MAGFARFPRAVSLSFRELVLDTLPALAGDSPETVALRGIAEYCIFGTYRYDTASLLAPYRTVAMLVGLHPKSRNYRARDWLKRFEDEVFPLNVTEASYPQGKARVMRPELPPEILAARGSELSRDLSAPRPRRVDFVTGKPISQREYSQTIGSYEERLQEGTEAPPGHPAGELLNHLNQQPPGTLNRLVTANWPAVAEAWEDMPCVTLREQRRRDAALRTLLGVQETRRMAYAPAPRTARIFARGPNIHGLQRELRMLALKDGIHLDMKSCQLAIVAKLWVIDALQVFLGTGESIWTELLSYLRLDMSFKPILKDALYALLFGMGRRRLKAELSEGTELDEGIGPENARRFLKHHLIRDLLHARRIAFERVRVEGGVHDAFGNWITVECYAPHEILAQQAQSYELRLMLASLPFLMKDDVYILSWLHDGMTLRIQNSTKEERRIRQVCTAIGEEADTLGIRVGVEVEG